ncbi:MAG: HNH endonuclease, partial [Mesorhizobium sp.]
MPMIDDPNGGRSVKEWIGKTPDSVPPATVRARIFLRADGICHI